MSMFKDGKDMWVIWYLLMVCHAQIMSQRRDAVYTYNINGSTPTANQNGVTGRTC
jgi:hypothetical protein